MEIEDMSHHGSCPGRRSCMYGCEGPTLLGVL